MLVSRRKTVKHSAKFARRDQDSRFRCQRPAHQLDGKHLCRDEFIHVGGSLIYASLPVRPFSCRWQPERIQGATYAVQSDVWSLGITMMQMALGRHPFPGNSLSILELLQFVVNEPAPTLPPDQFSPEFEDFLAKWLVHVGECCWHLGLTRNWL